MTKFESSDQIIIKVLWCGATTCRVSDIHSMWCAVVRFSPAVFGGSMSS